MTEKNSAKKLPKKDKSNSDEPIDGEDFFSDFYSISDTENPDWTVKRIHAFIKGMVDDGFIYRATDIELRTILSANGLLNTSGQHEKFLKNLIHIKIFLKNIQIIFMNKFLKQKTIKP